ncbi:MAG: EAL domain-containing protein [Janthinobacterium lividum]
MRASEPIRGLWKSLARGESRGLWPQVRAGDAASNRRHTCRPIVSRRACPSGLIGPLGRWVLERALRQRREWQDQGLAPPPIAINVSGLQLLDPGFAAMVEQSLPAHLVNSGWRSRDRSASRHITCRPSAECSVLSVK